MIAKGRQMYDALGGKETTKGVKLLHRLILYLCCPTVPLETAVIIYQMCCSPHHVAFSGGVFINFIIR
jgi:hypothetical protein